jgi:CheY-like chemotaxis protein
MTAHILVVDDEVDFCSNMSDILGDLGYGIDVAYRGAEAIERATHRAYDLFLLDYKLPCMNGAELYKRLKERGASTPAVIVTGHASNETFEQATSAGVNDVIEKPVDFGKLISVIERQISDRHSPDQS